MFRSKLLHIPARLACVRHAASVRPEPGSNSCVKSCIEPRSIASSSKLNYELTVFVLTVTRENHSLAFVFFILYRFQGSSRQPRVALALTAQLVYCTPARLSIPFSHFFTHFLVFVFFASIGPKKTGRRQPLLPVAQPLMTLSSCSIRRSFTHSWICSGSPSSPNTV